MKRSVPEDRSVQCVWPSPSQNIRKKKWEIIFHFRSKKGENFESKRIKSFFFEKMLKQKSGLSQKLPVWPMLQKIIYRWLNKKEASSWGKNLQLKNAARKRAKTDHCVFFLFIFWKTRDRWKSRFFGSVHTRQNSSDLTKTWLKVSTTELQLMRLTSAIALKLKQPRLSMMFYQLCGVCDWISNFSAGFEPKTWWSRVLLASRKPTNIRSILNSSLKSYTWHLIIQDTNNPYQANFKVHSCFG